MKTIKFLYLLSISLILVLVNAFPKPGTILASTLNFADQNQSEVLIADATPRRTNIPYFENNITWAKSAIFWFGINEQGFPGKNYADARLAYTPQALEIRLTIVDYYLWYNTNPQSGDDLSQYDAIAIYLDTVHNHALTPQTDDYLFLLGNNNNLPNASNYQREARGNGSTWNENWDGSWTALAMPSWSCDPGLNDNACGIDFGWIASFVIPWSTLGYSGPPAAGSLWGLGVQLFDRDDNPPAGAVAPEFWPETFQASNPSTWGEIHFGVSQYTPSTQIPSGSTIIRAASPTDNTVEDAWMGGGGWCNGGHEGEGETNHGDDADLFTGSEIKPTHFPCYNKSFLRFQLDAIPQGAEIISATLTLHFWGNAAESDPNDPQPPYSWVHLFSVTDDWGEMTIHWNNAPMAQENISAIEVFPYPYIPPVWPGQAYIWDATKAIAEAFAAGNPANLAIYSSDTGRDTSKYFTGSEVGDWDEVGRPTLKVIWAIDNPNLTERIYLPLVVK
ncbi:MAG TPA: hypothetical protein DEH25_09275 [Chloroflexi bacterium]|nr:hypothetical protein [Chloroflexota bacterium]